MKAKTLSILEKVKNRQITPKIAQEQLFVLFGVSGRIPSMPKPGDYYESEIEGMRKSTRCPGLTWKQEYLQDIAEWESLYGR
jgi:hypothetical protein